MKKISILSMIFALSGAMMMGCNTTELESRIDKLEGRVAELESKGAGGIKPIIAPETAAAAEPEVKPEGPLPEFTFEKELHDFGTIKEGAEVEYIFKFTNTGAAPLIISSAQGSCGCTVPEYPKEPIAVGGKGEIKVKFNSAKKTGTQNKSVTITSNTFPAQKKINIRAEVTPAPADQNPS